MGSMLLRARQQQDLSVVFQRLVAAGMPGGVARPSNVCCMGFLWRLGRGDRPATEDRAHGAWGFGLLVSVARCICQPLAARLEVVCD